MATLAIIFTATLIGSPHCVGMCGALVAFAVGAPEQQTVAGRALLQIAYHGGRLVTYASLGAVCGLLGAALDSATTMIGFGRVATVLAGSVMIAVGIASILRYRGVRLPKFRLSGRIQRAIVFGQRAAMGLRPFPRALTIGLLTGFLPCGFLYPFAAFATGAGGPLGGAAVMIAFWAGTVPVLVSLGIGVQALTGTLGRRLPLVTAILLVTLGLGTIGGMMMVPASAFESKFHVDPDATIEEQLQRYDKPTCPYCQPDAQ